MISRCKIWIIKINEILKYLDKYLEEMKKKCINYMKMK